MNVAHIEEQCYIYGPGCRMVLWLQGCSIHCKGCWNKQMWSFEPKNLLTIEQILDLIQKQLPNIEGVTILGGEPFDQFGELLTLCQKIRELPLSTILYTGYEMIEIQTKNFSSILNYIDILICGRYIQELRNLKLGLIGSSNQQIIFLTDRYTPYDLPQTNEIEISWDELGRAFLYGYPESNLLKL